MPPVKTTQSACTFNEHPLDSNLVQFSSLVEHPEPLAEDPSGKTPNALSIQAQIV